MSEMLSSSKVRSVVMEFWNSDVPAIENPEGIKTAKTAMKAVHDLDLIGKVIAIQKGGVLYLVNKTLVEEANGDTTK
jgi:hypothetical protein